MATLLNVTAATLALLPYLAAAFFSNRLVLNEAKLSLSVRVLLPALLCLPYGLVSASAGVFQWRWLGLYAVLPVAVACLLMQARHADPTQFGNWRDFLVLFVLGLAVDLRWFEGAWPAHLAVFNKVLLLDAGVYGFLAIRQLRGAGFDLRLRLRDAVIGMREFCLFTPVALVLGLSLGFLHLHTLWPSWNQFGGAACFTFFFIAVPEELFFRGWMQNLLESRIGRSRALMLTSILFGLSHWNKRTANFNWQYVLLAAIAGLFYGRAWRADRRVAASAVAHAAVDTVWSIWLR